MNEYPMVYCKHYRPSDGGEVNMMTGKVSRIYRPRGGATVVVLEDPATCSLHVGVSVCSKKDNFCKRTGREKAAQRAMAAAEAGVVMAYPKCRPTEGFSVKSMLASLPERIAQDLLASVRTVAV